MAQRGKQMKDGARECLAYHSVYNTVSTVVLLAKVNSWYEVESNTFFSEWKTPQFI
jgi:hypothetical protein